MDSLPINLSSPLLAKLPPDSSILTNTSSILMPHEVLEIREEDKDLFEDEEGKSKAYNIIRKKKKIRP